MKRLPRALLSMLLACTLFVPLLVEAGCASHRDDDVKTAIETLGDNGVAVYDSFDAKGPTHEVHGPLSAMRFTRWQLQNLVRAASAGAGVRGANLDSIAARAHRGAPGISYFIAGWLKRGGSPLATYARTFMPKDADWTKAPTLRYPLLVTSLFVADAARTAATPPKVSRELHFEQYFAAPARAGNACSTIFNFMSSTLADVTNALKSNGTGFFSTLWNGVVDALVTTAKVIVDIVAAPLFAIIESVGAIVALITLASSAIEPWTLQVKGEPTSIRLDDQAHEGTFTATLTADAVEWPEDIVDCGNSLAHVNLSNLNYKDAPITWDSTIDSSTATEKTKDAKIGDDKTARYTFETKTVQNDVPPECSVEQAIGNVAVGATMQRTDVSRLRELLIDTVYQALPSSVKGILGSYIKDWVQQASSNLDKWIADPVQGKADFVQLSRFEKDPEKCTPKPGVTASPGATPNPQSSAAFASIVGNWNCKTTITRQVQGYGPLSVTVAIQMQFDGNGMGRALTPGSAHWQGDMHHAAADTNMQNAGGDQSYQFKPTGPHDGMLMTKGRSQALHVDGNTMSFSGESPRYGTITYHCVR